MKIKYTFHLLVSVFLINCLYSCKTSKHLAYFKDLPDEAVSKITTSSYVPLKLQADDEVQITISSASPEASQFFNMISSTPITTVAGASNTGTASMGLSAPSQNYANLYRVSPEGFVTLPVLGDIKAATSTTEELKSNIVKLLTPYLKDAIVSIRLTNFKVTVIGEVGKPIVVPVNGQNINVLEAIGAAGDMTVFGVRKNVKIIRKLPDGNTEVAKLDFNKAIVLQSPFFQLKQNDIVYIQPNKNKGLVGSQTGIWVSVFSALASITAIVLTRVIK